MADIMVNVEYFSLVCRGNKYIKAWKINQKVINSVFDRTPTTST